MAIQVRTNRAAREVRYYAIDEARAKFKIFRSKIIKWFIFTLITFWFSPVLFIFCFIKVLQNLYEFCDLFFRNPYYMRQYMALFQPQTAEKVISIIGYRVYNDEVDGHLAIIKSGNMKSLADMQEKMQKITTNKHRWVGIDDDIAKTHIALIGTTGSGKTEALRSVIDDIMRMGGGIFFNDGKADTKMIVEVMAQAKECGRETSFKVLNLLKAEALLVRAIPLIF